MELCHEIYQNSNSGNCHQVEWNIEITTQDVKRRYKLPSKYKRKLGWTNLKKIETDCNRGFWKVVSLTVFLSFLFVVCDDWSNMLGWHKAVSLSFTDKLSSFIANIRTRNWRYKQWTSQSWSSSFNGEFVFFKFIIMMSLLRSCLELIKKKERPPFFSFFFWTRP